MPDDQALSQQDIQDLQSIASKLPPGHPQQAKISQLLNSQPTQFEQARTPSEASPSSRLLSGAGAGLKAMNPFHTPDTFSVATSGLGPLPSMARGAYRGFKEARESGQGILPSIASGAGSMLGLDTPGIRERAQRGDVAGVVGEGLPAIAATLIGGEAGRVGSKLSVEGEPVLRVPGTNLKIRYNAGTPDTPGGYGADLPSRGEFEQQSLSQAIKEGRAAKIPTRMPKSKATGPSTSQQVLSGGVTSEGLPGISATEDVAASHASTNPNIRAEINMPGTRSSSLTGSSGVSKLLPSQVPEASSLPGAGGEAWSMKRAVDPQLQTAVSAGDPGAIDVARRLNPTWRPIVIPKEATGYGGPRPESAPLSNLPPQEETGLPKQIMGQLPATTRATPTGELSSKLWEGLPTTEAEPILAPDEKAALETQAGRPLSDEEALALRRANIESKMGLGGGEDIGAIREQHRAGLEQKGRR